MKNWEKALQKFLVNWKDKEYVLGAMATGSYVAGTATKYSDVDVHIILSDKVKWRERGNKIVSGFLIEYFANPVRQLKKYLEEDYKDGRRTDARMYSLGKIIFDKTGVVKKLQENARKKMQRRFKEMNKVSIELTKYAIWDQFNDLNYLYNKKDSSFQFLYYLHLQEILKSYAKFLRVEIPPTGKLYRFLIDKNFRPKYNMENFPDKQFIRDLNFCIKGASFIKIRKLTNYVLNKMGGFNINGWKIRTLVK